MNKDPRQVMIELNEKFTENFGQWSLMSTHDLENTFIGLRGIALVGEILNGQKHSKHHEICCKIYDEIFSDGIASIYLASNAMDKPANIVLRRVLELGVAALYLWDMPHMAFSWDKHDQDLSFSEMLNHINSKGYISYINTENGSEIESEILPSTRAKKIYGALSDIVHGKIATFESAMEDRFKFVESDWSQYIKLIEEVSLMLLRAYLSRFNIKNEVFQRFPQAKMLVN